MASTKRTISSQILRRLNGGDRSVGSRFDPREIDKAVMQVVNSLLRPQFFESLQSGGNVHDSSVVCSYDNIPVISYKGVSKSMLPAIPVSLIKGQGIKRVYNSNDVNSNAFIPATDSELEFMVAQRVLSNLLGQIAYKQRGENIIYNKDLTALSPPINLVSMDLVVADFSKYGDNDLLPINADLERQVIDIVVAMFLPEQQKPSIVDPTSDTN